MANTTLKEQLALLAVANHIDQLIQASNELFKPDICIPVEQAEDLQHMIRTCYSALRRYEEVERQCEEIAYRHRNKLTD